MRPKITEEQKQELKKGFKLIFSRTLPKIAEGWAEASTNQLVELLNIRDFTETDTITIEGQITLDPIAIKKILEESGYWIDKLTEDIERREPDGQNST